jgi:hypothetical protein
MIGEKKEFRSCRSSGVQKHPTGKARADLRSNWRSADLAVAEKFIFRDGVQSQAPLLSVLL